MEIRYSVDAFSTLLQLINYIEETNTEGAGLRWLNRLENFLDDKLKFPQKIKLCNNQAFWLLQLRCIYFNDWVIAYSTSKNHVMIEVLLHKSRVAD
jgi:hypothetical protein